MTDRTAQPSAEPGPDCRRCPRLADYRAENRLREPAFHNAPVPATGSMRPDLLVVGLAPGLAGANRTGIPFLGDSGAGAFLRSGLDRAGFGTPRGPSVRLTNALRCVPPANRPLAAELAQCAPFLAAEVAATRPPVVLALGSVAHAAFLRALALRPKDHPFAHGARHDLSSGMVLFDSYHTSRQNTQTGRLTTAMFDGLLARIRDACRASRPA